MAEAIVFDLFGVIARTRSERDRLRLEAIAGVEPDRFREAYWAVRKPYDAGQSAADYWAAVADRLGVSFDDETVRALTEADVAGYTRVDDVMVALVAELAGRGHRLGLLSNIITDLVPVFEAMHGGWLAHFAARVYSCRIGVAKPDHRAFELTAARLGVRPADCVFIDDTEVNVLAARETGMRAEVFESAGQVRALVADRA